MASLHEPKINSKIKHLNGRDHFEGVVIDPRRILKGMLKRM
jgi:hypothetical protein